MGERVVVTGMGGELGTRVTNLLEAMPGVDSIVGIDLDPPRRRIPKAHFHLVDPRDRPKVVAAVRDADPTVLVHLGIYEPNARSSPHLAKEATAALAVSALGAAAQCPGLRRIVVRSSIEVYGRPRGAPTRPDEDAPLRPTTGYGRSLRDVEDVAAQAASTADVPLTVLRMAPVVGPHFPSPLGRYLRLPAVPVSVVSDLPFSLLHQEDAARATAAAFGSAHHGALNIVAPGAVTASQAARLGNRVPVPVLGPGWLAARALAEFWGAPLPEHIVELLVRGRTADAGRAAEVLGFTAERSTREVVQELYDWAEVLFIDVTHRAVA